MKISLAEAMGWEPILTYRQYRVWNNWFDLQWNRPSRSDYYLMRVAQRAQQSLDKKRTIDANEVRLEDQRVEFKESNSTTSNPPHLPSSSPSQEELRAQASAISKAVWVARMQRAGAQIKFVTVPRPSTESQED